MSVMVIDTGNSIIKAKITRRERSEIWCSGTYRDKTAMGCHFIYHKNAKPRLPKIWSSNTTSAGPSAMPRQTCKGSKCSSRG